MARWAAMEDELALLRAERELRDKGAPQGHSERRGPRLAPTASAGGSLRDVLSAPAPSSASSAPPPQRTAPRPGASGGVAHVPEVQGLKLGQRVYVSSDVSLIRAESVRIEDRPDRMREAYAGERGKVVRLYADVQGVPAVDLEFVNGDIKIFPASVVQQGPSAPAPAARAPAAAPPRGATSAAPPRAAAATAAPRGADLGRRGSDPSTGRTRSPVAAPARPPAAGVQRQRQEPAAKAAPTAAAAARRTGESAAARSRSGAAAPPAAEPGAYRVGQRLLMQHGGRTVQATVRFVGPTSFAEGEWVGVELSTPDGKNDGCVGGKRYFVCKPQHGLFRRPAELAAPPAGAAAPPAAPSAAPSPAAPRPAPAARVPPVAGVRQSAADGSRPQPRPAEPPAAAARGRAAVPRDPRPAPAAAPTPRGVGGAKTVRLWENGQYGSARDSVPYKSMVIRPMHKTMTAVHNTAARELGWHLLQRRVEVLYSETGEWIKNPAEIHDGQNLIASFGEDFIPPHAPLPRPPQSRHADPGTLAAGSETPPPADQYRANLRRRSPMPMVRHEGTAPIPQSARTVGGNKTVKVFVNGEYGSKWSDGSPHVTVSIKSSFKNMAAVRTLLARELRWNASGRKVEVVYNSLGEEVDDLALISDGDALVVSSGDAFVPPHEDVADCLPAPKANREQSGFGASAGTLPVDDPQPPPRRSAGFAPPRPAQPRAAPRPAAASPPAAAASSAPAAAANEQQSPPGQRKDRIAELMAEIAELERGAGGGT
eukprot:TRINITY_DN826_c3_g1_i1.p1 TRINITY_DN826_c3_g1~~TRINITY_DN826_c3_g1_i1.p1  ORF type:complete len:796 (+),score=213.17 TRINITY_DN826_c3_g1_i1:90-2390(+)